ncbi:hypothetical protein J6590_008849 [Homalodisca vitripennis]|nr:hypothetical protein J6590_008849 [Homalodisca vitripennis]
MFDGYVVFANVSRIFPSDKDHADAPIRVLYDSHTTNPQAQQFTLDVPRSKHPLRYAHKPLILLARSKLPARYSCQPLIPLARSKRPARYSCQPLILLARSKRSARYSSQPLIPLARSKRSARYSCQPLILLARSKRPARYSCQPLILLARSKRPARYSCQPLILLARSKRPARYSCQPLILLARSKRSARYARLSLIPLGREYTSFWIFLLNPYFTTDLIRHARFINHHVTDEMRPLPNSYSVSASSTMVSMVGARAGDRRYRHGSHTATATAPDLTALTPLLALTQYCRLLAAPLGPLPADSHLPTSHPHSSARARSRATSLARLLSMGILLLLRTDFQTWLDSLFRASTIE